MEKLLYRKDQDGLGVHLFHVYYGSVRGVNKDTSFSSTNYVNHKCDLKKLWNLGKITIAD